MPYVAGQHVDEAEARDRAVHRGDHRLAQAQCRVRRDAEAAERLLEVLDATPELREVGAGAERATCPRDDDDPHVRVVVVAQQRGGVLLGQGGGHSVEPLGAVERDGRDAVLDSRQQRRYGVAHGVLRIGRAVRTTIVSARLRGEAGDGCQDGGMAATVEELLDVLTLEQVEDDIFRGRSPRTSLQRVFGGQVLGQALMAAGRSVPADRTVHSLHAYFLRLGDPTVPIAYLVERVRDGGSFSTRRVVARQHGRPIFQMSASFQVVEPGLDHQDCAPEVPGPEELLGLVALAGAGGRRPGAAGVGRDRRATDRPGRGRGARASGVAAGGRAAAGRPAAARCVLAYASDMTLLAVAAVPHDVTLRDPRLFTASIDHAMWFHRPFRADEFLLHDEVSPSASGGRGTGYGRVFDLQGRLVATAVQEGLMRLRDGSLAEEGAVGS